MAEATAVRNIAMSRLTVLPYQRAVLLGFTAVYAGTALGAYSFGPIPLQWLTQFSLLGLAGVMAFQNRLFAFPGARSLVLFVVYAALLTLINSLLFNYARLLPELATTPYPLFIGLRFLNLFSFIAAAAVVYWLLRNGFREEVIARIAWVGAAGGAAAIYIYFAQINGWWEPSRTRLGTSGYAQVTEFTYAFHRALGTFREPSLLAEWLVLPFFVTFAYPGKHAWLPRVLVGGSLILSGSLTGLLSVVAGLVVALVVTNPFRGTNLKILVNLVAVFGVGLLFFNLIVLARDPEMKGFFSVISDRLEPILEGGGMSASNRGYVWDYFFQQHVPVIGIGLGHPLLRFTQESGASGIVSFLSLYFNYVLSLGWPALLFLLIVLCSPALTIMRKRRTGIERPTLMMLACFAAWMVVFAVHTEELSLLFGIVFGMLGFESQKVEAAA